MRYHTWTCTTHAHIGYTVMCRSKDEEPTLNVMQFKHKQINIQTHRHQQQKKWVLADMIYNMSFLNIFIIFQSFKV